MVKRVEYFERLLKFKDKGLIKVITGVRRCGKSTLLLMYKDYLLENGISEDHIIFINFEDLDNEELTNYKALYDFINALIKDDKKYYIILDEIQNVNKFQKTIDSLYLKTNVDIYITGSNAYMLSSEIATLISGRYVQIEMLPLSYKEYREGMKENNKEANLMSYIENTSFPQVIQFANDKELIKEYVESLFNTIVVKDILNRNKISDIIVFKSILRFIIDNIGSTISSKKISDTLTSDGRKVDAKTVEKYINAMIESYILYQVKRYDIKGKQYLKSQEKYYIVDVGFKYSLVPNSRLDLGHIIENIVYLELIRRGYKVFIGKTNEYEIDFVAHKGDEIEYIQVTASIRDSQTYEREMRPFKSIDDNYEKIILTLDDDLDENDNGVKIMNVERWILGGNL
ncbi:MAG: ATP-binding protein [Lachnospiraceae bacterium]|nr:ATP-binding protein [Lachnospiraceae bacterium]